MIKFRVWDSKEKRMIYGSDIGILLQSTQIIPGERYQFLLFSGLTDTKNQEIYEGDIIFHHTQNLKIPFIVAFRKGCFVAIPDIAYPDSSSHLELYNFNSEFDVIGNIYQNPNLVNLKGEETIERIRC